MQKIAERDRFRHIMFGSPSIGGRYSVLSDFGLVPAAAMGLDIGRLLDATQKMVRSCAADVPPADNPGVVLGTILGVLGKSGRDKVTIAASPGIADFGAWLEQLLAESTGKHGKGLIPVDAEPLGAPHVYGQDRLFVYLRLPGEATPTGGRAVNAGHPGTPPSPTAIHRPGIFRWDATALRVCSRHNPFDQPDV
jgi:glucose-6-phosphate isomerase